MKLILREFKSDEGTLDIMNSLPLEELTTNEACNKDIYLRENKTDGMTNETDIEDFFELSKMGVVAPKREFKLDEGNLDTGNV